MRFPGKYSQLADEPIDCHESSAGLALCRAGGETTVEKRLCRNSLAFSKPMRLEDGLPHLYLINTAGGLVQGDRLSVDITLKDGCRAHVTSQSANRIYRMDRNCAVQRTEISVGSGALLEYLPDANVPFAGSRLLQQTTIRLRKDSTLLCRDILHPGRYARGEELECDLYYSGVEIIVDDKKSLVDTVVLEPLRRDPRAPGVMGDSLFSANVYVYAENIVPFVEATGDWQGFTVPPGLLVIRLLGRDWLEMSGMLDEIWRRFRKVAGLAPPPMRKC
jgi:urease accessory protein UreH